MDPKTYRYTTMDVMHPICRKQFQQLETALQAAFRQKKCRSLFLPFETYRHPARQDWLLKTTTSTKAGAFESAHQYGVACDFVAFNDHSRVWSWAESEDWATLKDMAELHGLIVPISWDRPHVESPVWGRIRAELKKSTRSRVVNLTQDEYHWSDTEASA